MGLRNDCNSECSIAHVDDDRLLLIVCCQDAPEHIKEQERKPLSSQLDIVFSLVLSICSYGHLFCPSN